MKLVRYSVGLVLAFVTTFALLVLMDTLITKEFKLEDAKSTKLADIIMTDTEIVSHIAERKPDKPEDLEEPPPEVDQPEMEDMDVNAEAVNVAIPKATTGKLSLSGLGLGASDGEYLPIVKVAPIYPRRAQSRGIEGYCTVEYTVTKAGTVRDPVAVDCKPKGVFERTSLKASLKFKYKPRVVDGEPIDVVGVQNRFTYKLEK